MREWNLKREQLPALTLAADVRLSALHYANDQVWELALRGGEPAGLSLQTTFGLRARSMRLFPQFREGDQSVNDPAQFAEQPAIHHFYPNYALVTFSPFTGIDVAAEYWVVDSHMIAGRLRVINSGVTPRTISLAWTAILAPDEGGQRMAPSRMDSANILEGSCGGLAPVVYLSGSPEASHSPHANLYVQFELMPGLEKPFLWAQAALPTPEASYALARSIQTRRWDAEIARIQLTNAALVQIETGEKSWDLAFTLGQKTAISLLHGPTDALPNPAAVQTRRADQGFSPRGDGSDYTHLWSGQSTLDTWYLCQQILPIAPDLAKGLLRNLLAVQAKNGFIDLKPGLNGKNSGILATPVLADLTWRIFQATEDEAFLEESLPGLVAFINAWFAPENDRDGDGLPEFIHPMQSGFEDNPAFLNWQPWGMGLNISGLESPALMAFLLNECNTINRIYKALGKKTEPALLRQRAEGLAAAIQKTWNKTSKSFHYMDRDAHISLPGKLLGMMNGGGRLDLAGQAFPKNASTRLVVRIQTESASQRPQRVVVRGRDAQGQAIEEALMVENIRWTLQQGSWITRTLFSGVDEVEVDECSPEVRIQVSTLDYHHHDQSLFAPLWAKSATPEQAKEMVQKQLMNPRRYWQEYGIRACATPPAPEAASVCDSAWLTWNQLIGEGLLEYDYQPLAAELVGRLMDAIVQSLARHGGFRQHYHTTTGEGMGEHNALAGLPPLGLFLETLGVGLVSPWKVRLKGKNPFPWPVRVRYRGLTLERGLDKTLVIFPDGRSVSVTSPAACVVIGRKGE